MELYFSIWHPSESESSTLIVECFTHRGATEGPLMSAAFVAQCFLHWEACWHLPLPSVTVLESYQDMKLL